MMKIKRLNIDDFMKKEWMVEDCNYNEIDPVFFKQGVFLVGDSSWFENEYNGIWKAYEYDPSQFKYVLSLLRVEHQYNVNQINAMKLCIKEKVASKQQVQDVMLWDECHDLKITIRSVDRIMYRAKKKLLRS